MEANGKRIAGKAVPTGADRVMLDDPAVGVSAAGARTGVLALLVHAGERERTVRACDAFGTTRGRATNESRQARTDRLIVVNATLTIGPARRRIADVLRGVD